MASDLYWWCLPEERKLIVPVLKPDGFEQPQNIWTSLNHISTQHRAFGYKTMDAEGDRLRAAITIHQIKRSAT